MALGGAVRLTIGHTHAVSERLSETAAGAPRAARAGKLRYGWTTGACAQAAAAAALEALLGGAFPDPVTIELPRGRRPSFPLAERAQGEGWARAGVIKDAGDDPDVTHGALIVATVRWRERGAAPEGAGGGAPRSGGRSAAAAAASGAKVGTVFRAGPGVGTVTLPGLPVAVGEPAINPSPRRMIRAELARVAGRHGLACDPELGPPVVVEISVPGGEELAKRTWNPRLGIVGGISILGTTGVVVPYSCSAWIASVRQAVDVATRQGIDHLAAATGDASARAAACRHRLPELAVIDMGDFVRPTLRHVSRRRPRRLTLAGGFAKFSKLAAGALDLHSQRSQVDLRFLAELARERGARPGLVDAIERANSALEVLERCLAEGVPVATAVAERALAVARAEVDPRVELDVLVVDRAGAIVGEAVASSR